jgi:hypothetical protein
MTVRSNPSNAIRLKLKQQTIQIVANVLLRHAKPRLLQQATKRALLNRKLFTPFILPHDWEIAR